MQNRRRYIDNVCFFNFRPRLDSRPFGQKDPIIPVAARFSRKESQVFGPVWIRPDSSRLTFAKWLTDKKSPTTARVFVNRVWSYHFGTPFVRTPSDFGVRSDPPTHR